MPPDKGHAHLYAFGSYLLVGDQEEQASQQKVKRRASDVDVLVVAPSQISRKHHFFGTKLQASANAKDISSAVKQGVLAAILMRDERVKHVMAAPDAFVPCLRLEFMGVDVDLTLASLEMEALPPQQVDQPFWALRPPPQPFITETALPPRVASIESFRSMNGVRTTHSILRAVPSMELFRTVLVSVRRWAKARGLYGPTFGFPAGITWALLTAAVRHHPANHILFLVYGYGFVLTFA
jgi:poly(A) polymerase